jgi:hypothetical protein
VPIETVLRHLVVWQWLFAALSILVFQIEVDRLPYLLRAYALLEAAREPSAVDAVTGWLALLWAVGSLVASAGVFLLQRWSRPLFLAMAILGCGLQALLEPSVTTSWSVAAETGAQLLVGVTIGVIYFSPVRGHFARRRSG